MMDSPLTTAGNDEKKEPLMGSKSPKWLIKQRRQKINDARREARKANPGSKNLGVKRMAHHGGANKAAHP
jgi:hypothetical protein